ncbi:MAG TPA: hypothetical protein VFV10_14285 [Gammaproteobacteria bacterium]|nr:hypothetical protein [Gammaproteobacteria bacterium]
MIGRRVQCTLWQVEYRYLDAAYQPRPEPSSPQERMLIAQAGPDVPYRHGTLFVVTADPSGTDLVTIAERAVRDAGAATMQDFALISARRVADTLRGLARLDDAAS